MRRQASKEGISAREKFPNNSEAVVYSGEAVVYNGESIVCNGEFVVYNKTVEFLSF